MGEKYEGYIERFKSRAAELPYREINHQNLHRIGAAVVRCMDAAGDTAFPDEWSSMLEQIDRAYAENPEQLVVVLWRMLCNEIQNLEEKVS